MYYVMMEMDIQDKSLKRKYYDDMIDFQDE